MSHRKEAESKQCSVKRVQGYIVREEQLVATDDEVFSDDDDFSFDPISVEKLTIFKKKVLVQLIDDKGQLSSMAYIHGKFPYTGQWWHITVEVKVYHGVMYSQGLPSYKFRPDLGERSQIFKRLVSMVLKRENTSSLTQSAESKMLFSFIDRQRITDYSTLYRKENLVQLIQSCAAEQSLEPLRDSILVLTNHLDNSEELTQINVALNFPVTMAMLPWLQPRLAPAIIKHGYQSREFQVAVEDMIIRRPYELAFASTIKFKTKRSFPEVKICNFEKAGLWNGITQPYKDAIKIYNVLKEHCFNTGDTYMTRNRLNGQTPRYKGYVLTHFSEALEYLKSNWSVKEEEGRIYLKRLYECEVNIADTLHEMMCQSDPFTFQTDFSSDNLIMLSRDTEQRRAAEMISQKSVVVLCGRGGCGKTEVVSRICRVALDALYQEKLEEYQRFVRTEARKEINRRKEAMTATVATDTKDRSFDCGVGPVEDNPSNTCANIKVKKEPCDRVPESSLANTHGDHPGVGGDLKLNTHNNSKVGIHKKVGENIYSSIKEEMNKSVHKNIDVKAEKVVGNELQSKSMDDSVSDLFEDSDDSSWSCESFTHVKNSGCLLTAANTRASTKQNDNILEESSASISFPEEEDDDHPPIPDPTHRSYILLTAPTGKAAKVLGSRTGYTGFTLHQVMFKFMTWRKQLQQGPFPFKDVQILVVDECSLVAVSNLWFLLSILTQHASLRRIIFLGDLQQLPSIEPGNFLSDVYEALSHRDCAITLTTNHRSEGRLIVENAIRIGNQCLPHFDERQNFSMMSLKDKEHLELERDEAVRKLIGTDNFKSDRVSQFVAFRRIDCEAINNICSKLYTGHLCTDPSSKKSIFHEKFKICCTRNGTVEVIIIHDPANEAKDLVLDPTSQMLMPHQATAEEHVDSKTVEAERKSQEIRDKVAKYMELVKQQSNTEKLTDDQTKCIEEQIEMEETFDSPSQKEEKKIPKNCHLRLCNGEIFYIREIFKQQTKKGERERWIIEGEDGLMLSVLRKNLMKECRMKPCWCRTIHTYQGSEVEHLAYAIGAAGRQNWQHAYTAVTRGKFSVTIIGEDETLRKTINTNCDKRFSSLKERLLDLFGVKVCKENPDVDFRSKRNGLSEKKTVKSRPVYSQYPTSDDELDELLRLEEDVVWGDQDYYDAPPPSQPTTPSISSKRRKTSAASNAFEELDRIKQTFESCTPPCGETTSYSVDFSSEDDEEFLAIATQ